MTSGHAPVAPPRRITRSLLLPVTVSAIFLKGPVSAREAASPDSLFAQDAATAAAEPLRDGAVGKTAGRGEAPAESVSSLNGIRYAPAYPGADACAEINAANSAAVAAGGGIVDARGFQGAQTCAAGIKVGGSNSSTSQNVELLVGRATFTLPSIVVYNDSTIIGPGITKDTSLYPPANFVEAAGANSNPFILFTSVSGSGEANQLLENLVIDGNCRTYVPSYFQGSGTCNNPTGGPGIRLGGGNLRHVVVRAFASDGILLSGGNGGAWTDVISEYNGANGLHAENASDTLISMSQFEANHTNGIELDNSPTFRIEHSDIGDNASLGLYETCTGSSEFSCGRQIITGNQFGNNAKGDISFIGTNGSPAVQDSEGWVIAANSFVGRPSTETGYPEINIQDSGYNAITGNHFDCGSQITEAVDIHESSAGLESPDSVTGNAIYGTCATAPVIGTAATLWSGNAGFPVVSTGGGAFWISGSGAPRGPCTTGSLYSNTAGSPGSTLYDCVAGAWRDVN
jgi:hypothetical protein